MGSDLLPSRSRRYGVGKQMGNVVYVHYKYVHVLPQEPLRKAQECLPSQFSYDVVKFNRKTGDFSFVECSAFNKEEEPAIVRAATVSANGAVVVREYGGCIIYHHKWLFVDDDYDGFDVAESQRRSETWYSLPNVDRFRIGNRDYWEGDVVPRISSGKR